MDSALAFLASPEFIELIVPLLVGGTIVECAIRKNAQRDDWYEPVAGNIAGICLLLALGFALGETSDRWIVVALAGALAAFVADIAIRNRDRADDLSHTRREFL